MNDAMREPDQAADNLEFRVNGRRFAATPEPGQCPRTLPP